MRFWHLACLLCRRSFVRHSTDKTCTLLRSRFLCCPHRPLVAAVQHRQVLSCLPDTVKLNPKPQTLTDRV